MSLSKTLYPLLSTGSTNMAERLTGDVKHHLKHATNTSVIQIFENGSRFLRDIKNFGNDL